MKSLTLVWVIITSVIITKIAILVIIAVSCAAPVQVAMITTPTVVTTAPMVKIRTLIADQVVLHLAGPLLESFLLFASGTGLSEFVAAKEQELWLLDNKLPL